ncbi:hypothetical protein AK88_01558 [Plasmodium fragile]|uniref:Uncharacterized protein n=1 Tax=Plasmodium fragile TaxID=5857 RepID=A0A0D9QPL1_PLAFR|nr:uncharacterized protein AK88_01558 [Plasmodium fragile]KJP88868.1 hypothetical protein AK88_01558 [Plasmodium fragile]
MLSAHLANVASFKAKKKKKKKILIKKINSYNIKIRDEINKTFSQRKLADVYSFANRSGDKDRSEECVQLLQLIKQVFDVKNVYLGRTYLTGQEKKKRKKIIQFIQSTPNCDLENETICQQQQVNNIFNKCGGQINNVNYYSVYSKLFPFETGFLFPHFVRPDFCYDDPGDDLFTWVNPLHQGGNSARRVKSDMGPSAAKKQQAKEEEAEEGDEEDGDDGDDDDAEEDEEEQEEAQEHPLSDQHKANGHDSTAHPSEEKETASNNQEEQLQMELLNTLHMNLSYDCFYIYEVMRKNNSFLYAKSKPGDFLLIPLVYYSYYDWHFLHDLYCLRERAFIQSTSPCEHVATRGEADQVFESTEQGDKEVDKEEGEEKAEKEAAPERSSRKDAKPKMEWKKGGPVEMCLCLDNRGSVNKMSRRQINDLINFSYFLITRIMRAEHKCVEEQVDYMISCQHGEEKEAIDTLSSKMKSENEEHIISEFKNTLTEHPLLNKSEDLTKYMCLLQWTKKEINKHQQRILQMSKVKVEWNQNYAVLKRSVYMLLGYDYSMFGAQDDVKGADAQWRKLILCVNTFLIDKLTSFDPLLSFEEKRTEDLLQMDVLLDQVSSSKRKKIPPQMENIATFGLTLLAHFNKVTRDILKAILKVKEEQVANGS